MRRCEEPPARPLRLLGLAIPTYAQAPAAAGARVLELRSPQKGPAVRIVAKRVVSVPPGNTMTIGGRELSMDPAEQKALADIDQYGCHVLHVAAEDELPPFSYSVGIWRSSGRPEVIAIGLKQNLAHFIVNEYNQRVQGGEVFVPGQLYSGFIEGFEVTFEQVERELYPEYFGWDLWLYGGLQFEALQLVYPSTTGVWPWQPSASEGFRTWQPLLTSAPVSPSRYP